MHMRKPIIGIPADRRLLNSHWFHCVGEKYINAIVQAADAVPVLRPPLQGPQNQHVQGALDHVGAGLVHAPG